MRQRHRAVTVAARDLRRSGRRWFLWIAGTTALRLAPVTQQWSELLILDDWGLAPLTSQQGRDLLEIVDDRHGRGSTIVTSQLPVDHWHEVIVDPTIADAVLDRLVHTAHRLALDGETLRKPPEKSGKRGKLDTDTAA